MWCMNQFGHEECSTGWIAKVRKLNVVAQERPSRPRKSWNEVLSNKESRSALRTISDGSQCSPRTIVAG